MLIALSMLFSYFQIFLNFSYLDKLLGTLTRVVKVDHTTLGLLETAICQRVVPQSYCLSLSLSFSLLHRHVQVLLTDKS